MSIEIITQPKNVSDLVQADFNPTLPEVIADPYPAYRALREAGPIVWCPRLEAWLVTEYALMDSILRDRRFVAGRPRVSGLLARYSESEREALAPVRESLSRWALFADGAYHARLRGAFAKAFTPGYIEKLRPEIERIAAQLLDRVTSVDRWDLLAEVAGPLPIAVIGNMLGVPEQDSGELKRWSEDVAILIGDLLRPFSAALRAQQSIQELERYFQAHVESCRRNPREDLIGMLVASGLSNEEILASASLVLFAGHETTTHLISNGTLALLRSPDAWQVCRSGRVEMAFVVEEMLRFDGPIQMVTRISGDAVEIAGNWIEVGQRVFCVVGAAHRDPRVFTDPDRFDPLRPPSPRHFGFGQGVHFCPGAALSRLEAATVFRGLFERFPALRLSDPDGIQWRKVNNLRGVQSLWVERA